MNNQLIQGRVYLMDGKPYRAGLVNDCRARLDPLFRIVRHIHDHARGRRVTIHAHPESVNVSPMSQLEEART